MSCSSSNSPSTFSANSYYVGINLENILYGIETALYFQTMQIFLGRRKQRRELDIVFAIFSTVMFLLVTIFVAVNALGGQGVWLTHRNYPGGENAYIYGSSTNSYSLLGALGGFSVQQMADGLMIYRSRIMCASHVAIIIPCILWLATFALGISICWVSVTPGHNPFIGLEARLAIAYFTISVILNVTLTCMMCYRMLSHGKKVKECLGTEFASPYFSIVRLLVESALPLALSGIAYLAVFMVLSPMDIAFSRVYILMTCVSPQMLILRFAKGKVWDKDSFKTPDSVIAFSPGGSSHPTFFDESRLEISGDIELGTVGVPRTREPTSPFD